MIRSTKIVLIIAAVIVVSGASIFGIIVAVNWGRFEYSDTYYYQGAPPPIESLSLNSDIGAINIKYNTTPTNYIVKIDLDIRIEGGFVAGKSFSDFFENIIWVNDSSPITFGLDKKPTTGFIFPLIYNIIINVTLRTDIIYDTTAFTSTGAVNMDVPDNIIVNNTILGTSTGSIHINAAENTTFQGNLGMTTSTGSVALYAKQTNFTHGLTAFTSTGSLVLNFTDCIIGDNLIGTVSTGSITINSYNMEYIKNSHWDFETSTGSIDINVYQYIEMGANITGSLESSTGSIDLYYIDNLDSVGAKFTGSTSTGAVTYSSIGTGGFNVIGSLTSKTITSINYDIALYTYTLSLSTSTGSVDVAGQSSHPYF